jgi:hypothetical protein
VGVRQGDNVPSVIFLFLMSAFAETLENEWSDSDLYEPEFINTTEMIKGQLTGHTRNTHQRTMKFIIHQILYIDDGAFFFDNREDAEKGLEMIHRIFASFGLEMHIGRGEQPSKTEIMYILTANFYTHKSHQTLPQHQMYINSPADDTTNDDEIRISTKPRRVPKNKTFSTMSQKEREALYNFSQKTNRIKVADEFVDFVKHFIYLGSFISFDLTDDFDIDHRISTANKAMGALKHLWDNPYANLKAKQQIFIAILLLWGCESWAL